MSKLLSVLAIGQYHETPAERAGRYLFRERLRGAYAGR